MHALQNLTYSFKKHSLFNNRTDIDWLTLGTYLGKYNYEVVPAQKDGHCFITAIRLCLECDHGMIFTDGDIKKLITWCSTVKEGGPFSLTTSPFPPYGGNLQQIHT